MTGFRTDLIYLSRMRKNRSKTGTVFPASAIACGVFQFSEAHLVSWQTTGREDQFRRTVPTLPFNAATLAERSGLCRATERIRSRLPPISLPGWEVRSGLPTAAESPTSEWLKRTTRA